MSIFRVVYGNYEDDYHQGPTRTVMPIRQQKPIDAAYNYGDYDYMYKDASVRKSIID